MLNGLTILFAVAAVTVQPSGARLRADRGVILPEREAKNVLTQCTRRVPTEVAAYWTPDQQTIRRLERALAPALQHAIDQEVTSPAPSVGDYYRQYVGLAIGGRRVVYINGFHRSHLVAQARADPGRSPTWRTRAVNVCDGRTTFFGAEYDPATEKVQGIRFNQDGGAD